MVDLQVIDKLDRLVDEVSALHSKLILLIGGPQSGKTALMEAYGSKKDLPPLRVGAELGAKLAALPQRRRQLQTTSILRDLADQHAKDNLLLMDNGSLRAGQRAAAVMSLIQSARMNGHDPYAYLKDVLIRLPTHKASRIEELLPHRWQPAV